MYIERASQIDTNFNMRRLKTDNDMKNAELDINYKQNKMSRI